MAIGISTSESNQAFEVTSLNVPYPSASGGQGSPPDTTHSGYLAFVWTWSAFGVTTHTTPSGWTLVDTADNSDDQRLSIYRKAYDASTGSVTFALSNVSSAMALVVLATGVNVTDPVMVTVAEAVPKTLNTSHATPAVTTAHNNSMVLSGWFGRYPFITTHALNWYPTSGAVLTQWESMVGTEGGSRPGAAYVGSEILGTAGAAGNRTAISALNQQIEINDVSTEAIVATVVLNPYLGPSAPVLIQPNGGESIIVGVTYPITWQAATDPNTAQGSLTYKVDYSTNNGATWTELEDATAGGATTYNWNTAGLTPGTQYRVRVRASDGSNTGPFDTSTSAFTLLADLTPGAPTNLSPNGGVFDRAQDKVFTWVFNDTGDTQSAYQIQGSTDGFATTPYDTGKITSTTSSRNIAGATFSHANWQWRVRTWDFADTVGAYSAAASFLAGDKPSAPNITAPTAGSPPTTSLPTHIWTATGQVARKIRIEVDSSEIFTSGKVVSSAVSIPSPISYANGVEYELFVSIWNSDDLQSNEDSGTFTPSFTGPDQPDLLIIPIVIGGYIQATITNTDDPEQGNELWRYVTSEGLSTAIRIAAGISANGTFRDYNVQSGTGYSYFARAIDVDGLITDSDVETGTLTLDRAWLHVVQRDVPSSNALQVVGRGQLIPATLIQGYPSASMRCEGRDKPVTVYGQARGRTLTVTFRVGTNEATTFSTLEAIFATNAVVCIRDQKRNMLFGRLLALPIADFNTYSDVNASVVEAAYEEAI